MSRQRPDSPAWRRKVASRQAAEARRQLAPGRLSHQERRRLRFVTGGRDATPRPRRREFKHLVVVAAGTIGAMALVAAIVGLIPAIEAAGGQGTAGTFTPGNKPCLIRKGGCAWSGTFRSPNGATMQHVYYDGTLSAGPGRSTSVPAIYPGGGAHIVYPPHDSHAWVSDLFLMAFVGGLAGFLLWLIPLGLSGRESTGAVV